MPIHTVVASSDAPVIEDESGRVRVMGIAAGDATNVQDRGELARRQELYNRDSSADSPDFRVVEGTGLAARDANLDKRGSAQ